MKMYNFFLNSVLLSLPFFFIVSFTNAESRKPGFPPSPLTLPIQLRSSFALNGGMTISWSTWVPVTSPTILYYTQMTQSSPQKKIAISKTYPNSSTYQHHATLSDLLPSTAEKQIVYFYTLTGSNEVHSFISPLASGDLNPFTFAVLGDLGLFDADQTMAAIRAGTNDPTLAFWYHLGDIVYADNWYDMNTRENTTDWNYERAYETWMDLMEPITNAKPYMTLPGNHENDCTNNKPKWGSCAWSNFASYNARWEMPGPENSMFYSFDYGQVHFISINTETDYPNSEDGIGGNAKYNAVGFGDKQMRWLEQDLLLANNNRERVPWIIVATTIPSVTGHRPWYTSSSDNCPSCQAAFEPLFAEYKVDLTFFGHKHQYERMYPTYNNTVMQKSYMNPTVPISISTGAAGHIGWLESEKNATSLSTYKFIAASDYNREGWGKVYVHSPYALTWRYYSSATYETLDEIIIQRTKIPSISTPMPTPTPLPVQLHLAYAGSDGMTISWSTYSTLDTTPMVHYSENGVNWHFAAGTTSTYSQSYTYHHHVTLTNLLPSTTYYYTITHSATRRNFTTAPLPGDSASYTVAVIGDGGLYDNDATTLSLLLQTMTDKSQRFIMHVGDLGYADSNVNMPDNQTYYGAYEAWVEQQTAVMSLQPYQVLPGNHEATCGKLPIVCPKALTNFSTYLSRFHMNGPDFNSMFYSFDHGLVHYIMINTETDYPGSSYAEGFGSKLGYGGFGDQMSWLKADLSQANANRATIPWIIVSGHRPWYTAGTEHCEACRLAFEPLFSEYRVDLAIFGHKHWYSRTYPINNNQIAGKGYDSPSAPVYIVLGNAGHIGGIEVPDAVDPSYIAAHDYSYHGYAKITVVSKNQLIWTYYSSLPNEAVRDTFTINKSDKIASDSSMQYVIVSVVLISVAITLIGLFLWYRSYSYSYYGEMRFIPLSTITTDISRSVSETFGTGPRMYKKRWSAEENNLEGNLLAGMSDENETSNGYGNLQNRKVGGLLV